MPDQQPLHPSSLIPGVHNADEIIDSTVFPIVSKLARRDLQDAKNMTIEEVRYAVDLYYQVQKFRKTATLQVKATQRDAKKAEKPPEPTRMTEWTLRTFESIEATVKTVLDIWTDEDPVGQWSKTITGIGPIVAAGLLAHIDLEPFKDMGEGGKVRVPIHHAGHIFRFAGLDPTQVWKKGCKRPWNARLKTLCWNIGQSFMKHRKGANAFYGRIYEVRKAKEIALNRTGKYADQAAASLGSKRFGVDTIAPLWYSGCLPAEVWDNWQDMTMLEQQERVKRLRGEPGSGVCMLPPARIELRAERYAVKFFLSHWFQVAYELKWGKKPPVPWVVQYGGHDDLIPPPNWPMLKK